MSIVNDLYVKKSLFTDTVALANGAGTFTTTVTSGATSNNTIIWPVDAGIAGQSLLSGAGAVMTWGSAPAHAKGTAALPGASFTGDLDTGMSAETADTLILSTGGGARITVTDTAANFETGVNVVIAGNLTVNGTTTTIDTTNTTIADNIIILNSGETNGAGGITANNATAGIEIERGTVESNVLILFDEGSDSLTFGGDGSTAVGTGRFRLAEHADLAQTSGAMPGYDANGRLALASGLASGEVTQLQAIGATTISATQWGYLGAMDQGVTTSSNVGFGTVGGSTFTASAEFINAVGSASDPSYTFTGDTDTGLSSAAADTLIVSTGGAARITVTDATTTISNDLAVSGSLTLSEPLVADVSAVIVAAATAASSINRYSTTGSAFAANLPDAASNSGMSLMFYLAVAGNDLTITAAGSDTVDNGVDTTLVLNVAHQRVTLTAIDTNWVIS